MHEGLVGLDEVVVLAGGSDQLVEPAGPDAMGGDEDDCSPPSRSPS
jgi:hypothetical protein